MLRPLLALLVLLPVSWAAQCCSGEDRRIVLRQWDSAFNSQQSGDFKVLLGKAIFKEFLEKAPSAKNPLANVHPGEEDNAVWKAHTVRVMTGLDRVINLLDNPPALAKDLDHLATQHQNRPGVTLDQFKVIGGVLRHLLPNVLTDYDADAWDSCLSLLGKGIASRLG
jgi:hypothetical protein